MSILPPIPDAADPDRRAIRTRALWIAGGLTALAVPILGFQAWQEREDGSTATTLPPPSTISVEEAGFDGPPKGVSVVTSTTVNRPVVTIPPNPP